MTLGPGPVSPGRDLHRSGCPSSGSFDPRFEDICAVELMILKQTPRACRAMSMIRKDLSSRTCAPGLNQTGLCCPAVTYRPSGGLAELE